ncbi:hypothetical protein [Archangium primigenium]|uniref:hypothetical protein n=1 Tax=[Archangium] primigenium TaxID=2792470 RepID=UPI00195A9240|nr:hypothetical protein [Archangium primigenium]MBM7116397.1 hypothetical protein [Archangium primigenium]
MNRSHSSRSKPCWKKALSVLAALGLGGLGLHAPAAHAGLTLLTCLGAEHATFSPGLTFTPQEVSTRIEQQMGPCVGLGAPANFSGTAVLAFTAEQSCLSTAPLEAVPGSQLIRWSTGETSTFTYVKTYVQNAGQVVAVKAGTITAGRFAGNKAVMTIPATGDLVACATPDGSTENSALIQFVISPL